MVRRKTAFGMTLLIFACFGAGRPVEARPEYNKTFWMHYAKPLAAHNAVKCVACHEGADKKNRNSYGKVVGEKLKEKGVKDVEKIKAALEQAAKEKSAIEGKTFGDLIEAGQLPASKP